ncbi:hypothetical protein Plhal710r2_c018g0076801 [Plasmopara halstedii]
MMATNSVANERKKNSTRFNRLRLHGSAMLHAKGLLQQTVVTKLCPIVQLRLSPLPSEYNNNVKQTEDNFFRSLKFCQAVLCMVSDSKCTFQMTSEGCGGAYFLTMETILYMAPNNPRGYVKENAVVGVTEHPVNKGFRVGNGAFRERAAYLLDSAYGNFSEKEGSMQRFIASQCSADDMGTLNFAIPEVHKIGILDVRLLIRTATPAIFY